MDNKEYRIHPNQKPVALYEWLLDKYYAKTGDTILDTHVGSASSLVACRNRGYEVCSGLRLTGIILTWQIKGLKRQRHNGIYLIILRLFQRV